MHVTLPELVQHRD